MLLSKTNFLLYRDCPHNAWLKVHRPEVYEATPPSVFDQSIMEAGNDVDVLARELFPAGTLIARGDAVNTARLVAEDAPILYQPVFDTDRLARGPAYADQSFMMSLRAGGTWLPLRYDPSSRRGQQGASQQGGYVHPRAATDVAVYPGP